MVCHGPGYKSVEPRIPLAYCWGRRRENREESTCASHRLVRHPRRERQAGAKILRQAVRLEIREVPRDGLLAHQSGRDERSDQGRSGSTATKAERLPELCPCAFRGAVRGKGEKARRQSHH